MAVSLPAARRDPVAWELAHLPQSADPEAARRFCRAVAAAHYENFTVASLLVPRRLRQHLANVYTFARWADDLADEASSPEVASAALADWRRQLEACFAGRPEHPVFVALAETITATGLTIEPFAHLLDAFEQDQAKTRYATRAELLDYCRRSADPVGRIVLALEGCRDPEAVGMSDAICSGLQLVNFWQDITRDLLAGRIYLPADDMARHGVDEAMLAAPVAAAEVRALIADEVAWARELFAAGGPLVAAAPRSLRPAISMFLAGGRAVADAIEQAGYDTLARRPTVGRLAKLKLAARAAWAAARSRLGGQA
ncbi:MAG: All-trans-phytoene synthase [Planctomycetota bacterium]|jgi:squalene synthase HpnC